MKLSCLLRSVCFISLFSHENKESVYLVCVGIENWSMKIKIASPELCSAPLKTSFFYLTLGKIANTYIKQNSLSLLTYGGNPSLIEVWRFLFF